jgi:hypothetical protein
MPHSTGTNSTCCKIVYTLYCAASYCAAWLSFQALLTVLWRTLSFFGVIGAAPRCLILHLDSDCHCVEPTYILYCLSERTWRKIPMFDTLVTSCRSRHAPLTMHAKVRKTYTFRMERVPLLACRPLPTSACSCLVTVRRLYPQALILIVPHRV